MEWSFTIGQSGFHLNIRIHWKRHMVYPENILALNIQSEYLFQIIKM